ncbi:MAG: colicin transporter [Sphingobium sp.]|nr:colicin transporter [Sphingobium sp.]
MIAIKRLQSIMWILVVAMGALCAYLTSLSVGTERNRVTAVERQIYQTRANIRYLEVEFSARSTMRQLAAWNAQDIKYSVPGAGQYLSSEQQLAALDAIEPKEPSVAAPPVMAAMAEADPAPAAVPAMVVPVKAEVARPSKEDRDFALVRSAVAAEPVRPRTVAAIATPKPEAAPRVVKLVDVVKPGADPSTRRATRLALLDQTLLGKPIAKAGKTETGKAAR